MKLFSTHTREKKKHTHTTQQSELILIMNRNPTNEFFYIMKLPEPPDKNQNFFEGLFSVGRLLRCNLPPGCRTYHGPNRTQKKTELSTHFQPHDVTFDVDLGYINFHRSTSISRSWSRLRVRCFPSRVHLCCKNELDLY